MHGPLYSLGPSDGTGKFHVDDAFQIIVVTQTVKRKIIKMPDRLQPRSYRCDIPILSGNNTVKLMTWSTIAPYYVIDGWLTFLAKSSAHENTSIVRWGVPIVYADQGYSIATVTLDGQVKGSISNYTFSSPVTGNHTLDVNSPLPPPVKLLPPAGTGGTTDPSGVNSVAFGGSLKFTITLQMDMRDQIYKLMGKHSP